MSQKIKPWPKDNRFHVWGDTNQATGKTATGWMPFLCGQPYWPLKETRAKAVEYATWKMGYPQNKKVTIVKCTVKCVTLVKRHANRKRAAACGEVKP